MITPTPARARRSFTDCLSPIVVLRLRNDVDPITLIKISSLAIHLCFFLGQRYLGFVVLVDLTAVCFGYTLAFTGGTINDITGDLGFCGDDWSADDGAAVASAAGLAARTNIPSANPFATDLNELELGANEVESQRAVNNPFAADVEQ